MQQLKAISQEANIDNKKVLLRIDTDVDIENNVILDDTRLAAALPSLNFLLEHKCQVILIGHLGRPDQKYQLSEIKNQKLDTNLSLRLIAGWFGKQLKTTTDPSYISLQNFPAWKITDNVTLLENIRFYDDEEKNDPEFAKQLAFLGELYINDAFAVSHRAHASLSAITAFLPSYAGIHLQKEVEELSRILETPERPLVVLIGGAKIETKLPMVEKMHKVADYVLVGGEIAEQDKVLIQVQHEKLEGRKSIVLVSDLEGHKKDITPKSVENFIQVLNVAKTIVWNGPVGLIGKEEIYEQGTKHLAEAIVQTSAYKIVGGGDSLTYLRRLNMLEKFDFVSTGGGAMLEFLSGKELPGIKPLIL